MAKRISNKKAIARFCSSLRDEFGLCEVKFNRGSKCFVGEGIDGGYFGGVFKMGRVSLTADHLKGKIDYYCTCDHCGNWYQLGKEGETCQECKIGKLNPQDVEPWGNSE
ncbi:hypothetical protein [Vibrio mimicus]|uniref:hypothetical protein n=1 Tax=Vibrio mimicus TaxID=674 RepID=UPI0005114C0C|nr:hypothetical protein [Vibrio mimicus]